MSDHKEPYSVRVLRHRKLIATGLAAGIALDATVVRMLVVPAVVSLLGKANWWLPAWAGRLVAKPSSELPGQGGLD